MNLRIVLSCLVLLLGMAGCAGPPAAPLPFLNASFEAATPRGMPVAWYIEANAATATIAVDAEHRRDGERALHVSSSGDDPVVLYTPLNPASCLSAMEATAAVYSESPEIEVTPLFLLPGQAPQMGKAADVSNGDWSEATVSRTVDEGCLSDDLLLGLLITGTGDVWIDAIRLTSGERALSTGVQETINVPVEDIDTVRRHALVLQDDRVTDEVGEAFQQWVGGARVVGLGENSHGARALFDMKKRLVQRLVEDARFNVFALEMPSAAADVVDDYVQGRTDDEQKTLRALSYPAWQSEELWSVVEWLRDFNRGGRARVVFRGLDTPRTDAETDDDRMTAEVLRLLAEDDAARIIVWADNTHVTKTGQALGAQLRQQLGDSYFAAGFTFYSGHYSAYGPAQRYTVDPGYPGTHEQVLEATGLEAFLLDLRTLPADHALRQRRGFRYIGSRPQQFHQFYPHRLNEHFDLLGFVRETEATRYLLEHQF